MRKRSATAVSPITEHGAAMGFRVWQPRPSIMIHAHAHPDIEVNFLTHGTARYFISGRFQEVQAGEIALFWAGLPHQMIRKERAMGGIWMTIPLQWMLRWKHAQCLRDLLLKAEMVKYPAADHPPLFRQWLADFNGGRPDLRDLIAGEMESHFSRLSLSLRGRRIPRKSRSLSTAARRIEEITAWLGANYTRDITVEDIARAMRTHPKYLLALFRKTCHITLWEYVLRLRLAHAQRLLLTTDRTVLDVALDAGFGSLSAFYHAFRKYVPDATPSRRRLPEAVPKKKSK